MSLKKKIGITLLAFEIGSFLLTGMKNYRTTAVMMYPILIGVYAGLFTHTHLTITYKNILFAVVSLYIFAVAKVVLHSHVFWSRCTTGGGTTAGGSGGAGGEGLSYNSLGDNYGIIGVVAGFVLATFDALYIYVMMCLSGVCFVFGGYGFVYTWLHSRICDVIVDGVESQPHLLGLINPLLGQPFITNTLRFFGLLDLFMSLSRGMNMRMASVNPTATAVRPVADPGMVYFPYEEMVFHNRQNPFRGEGDSLRNVTPRNATPQDTGVCIVCLEHLWENSHSSRGEDPRLFGSVEDVPVLSDSEEDLIAPVRRETLHPSGGEGDDPLPTLGDEAPEVTLVRSRSNSGPEIGPAEGDIPRDSSSAGRTPVLQREVCDLSCGHTFHRLCIERWFIGSNRCPTCRDEGVAN